MELRHLRYLVALAEELHFGRAALRLSITQPPLSFAIASLENELGVRLFERDNKRVALTAAGRAYVAEARAVLERIEHANDAARAIAAGKTGRLDVGFTGSMVYRGLPQVLQAFAAEHPGIDISLHELSSVEQLEALQMGKLHAGFLNVSAVPDGLGGHALLEADFVCCLPQNHALAGKKAIDLVKLAQEDFIMFAREISPVNYDNVIATCRQAGFEPRTRHAARQWLSIISLVANGLGVALVPATMKQCGIAGASFVPIRNARAESPAFLLWHPQRNSPALENFLAVAGSFCRAGA